MRSEQIGGAVAGAWLGGALGRKSTVLLSSGWLFKSYFGWLIVHLKVLSSGRMFI